MTIQEYKNYGKCVVFEANGLMAMVTVDLGPRIIYYGTKDFNFMNEDLERNVSNSGEFFDNEYKPGEKWYLYGGHRVWKSPEDMYTYTPDNYPVEYKINPDGMGGVFVCNASKRFVYKLVVEMDKNGGLSVQNITRSRFSGEKFYTWALSVVCKNGTLRVPLNDKVDDLNPINNLVFWPYDDLKDERLTLTHDTLTVRQTDNPRALKLGVYSKKGRAYYTVGDKTLKWSVEAPNKDGRYSDFGCNFETYTNQHILEVEWLSAENGDRDEVILTQRFEIIDTPENFD
jgi:hypothetical protein